MRRRQTFAVCFLLLIAILGMTACWVALRTESENELRRMAEKPAPAPVPPQQVKGRITGPDNQPIGGVTVCVPGSADDGARDVTNGEGHFSLPATFAHLPL